MPACKLDPKIATELVELRESGVTPTALAVWYEQKTGVHVTRQTIHNWLKAPSNKPSTIKVTRTRALTAVTTMADAELFLGTLRASVMGLVEMGHDRSVDDRVRRHALETSGLLSIDMIELGMELEEMTAEFHGEEE